jgi:hypothetical protein
MNVTNVSVMAEWCQILELVLAYLRNKDWVTVEATIEQMELTKEMVSSSLIHQKKKSESQIRRCNY